MAGAGGEELLGAILDRIKVLESKVGRKRWWPLDEASIHFGFGSERESRPFKRFLSENKIKARKRANGKYIVDGYKVEEALERDQVTVPVPA
ncbi:hypothetical protein MLD52_21725 [Puniceicoccaceae bacterium K14]|nr:hypothetical protein [Puniceicoccaceae bacterium K14]